MAEPTSRLPLARDPGGFYDEYWLRRRSDRTQARSRERAGAALDLLAAAGVRGGRLLDVGCGPGWALERFQTAGFAASGLDASASAVEEARARGLDARVLDLETQAATAALGGAGFDVVVALEVLEHLFHPREVLEDLLRLVQGAGFLVVSLPNEISLPARLKVVAGRLPFGGHEDPHVRHFDRAGARRLFAQAGARVLAERPLSVVPPRWPVLRTLARPLVALLPGSFAIATVYLLARAGEGGVDG